MSVTRDQQKAATRKSILDAAIQLFASHGYDGSNFREISAICGARRSLILYHFQSKAALWMAAAEEVERRFNAAFESNYDPLRFADDRGKVHHTLTCFVNALTQVPEYGQIYLREGSSEGPRMEWLARHFAPRSALNLKLADKSLENRIKTTILRDILASLQVAFVTLAPLLDRSRAIATKQTTPGGSVLSAAKRDEFVGYLVKLIF